MIGTANQSMMNVKIIDRRQVLIGALMKIREAAKLGRYDGTPFTKEYLYQCRYFIEEYECVILFCRDVNMHGCGWFKNPDFDQCLHLSISFPYGGSTKGRDKIIDALFGANKNMLWIEPPFSPEGKSAGVWHYRLMCDKNWQPIIPRGEVYSTEFTERGWKSFSELHAF